MMLGCSALGPQLSWMLCFLVGIYCLGCKISCLEPSAFCSACHRSLRNQLAEVQPATMASLCTTVARAGAQPTQAPLPACFLRLLRSCIARTCKHYMRPIHEQARLERMCLPPCPTQMDLDLLEAYLSHLIGPELPPQSPAAQNPAPSSSGSVELPSTAAPAAGAATSAPSQLCALVVGFGEAAGYARLHGNVWKPRSSLLGPFMAHFMQLVVAHLVHTKVCKQCYCRSGCAGSAGAIVLDIDGACRGIVTLAGGRAVLLAQKGFIVKRTKY
eukprot:1147821-Pelagomonas_calceolata.AAC.2